MAGTSRHVGQEGLDEEGHECRTYRPKGGRAPSVAEVSSWVAKEERGQRQSWEVPSTRGSLGTTVSKRERSTTDTGIPLAKKYKTPSERGDGRGVCEGMRGDDDRTQQRMKEYLDGAAPQAKEIDWMAILKMDNSKNETQERRTKAAPTKGTQDPTSLYDGRSRDALIVPPPSRAAKASSLSKIGGKQANSLHTSAKSDTTRTKAKTKKEPKEEEEKIKTKKGKPTKKVKKPAATATGVTDVSVEGLKKEYFGDEKSICLDTADAVHQFWEDFNTTKVACLTCVFVESTGHFIHTCANSLLELQYRALKTLKRKQKAAQRKIAKETGATVETDDAQGKSELIGFAILVSNSESIVPLNDDDITLFFVPVSTSRSNGGGSADNSSPLPLSDRLRFLLKFLSCSSRGDQSTAIMCHKAKDVQVQMLRIGVEVPEPQEFCLLDPALMAWLDAPELSTYTLENLKVKYDIPDFAHDPAASATTRVRNELLLQMKLGDSLWSKINDMHTALKRETRISSMLARMEAEGMKFDCNYVLEKGELIKGRIKELEKKANEVVGGELNMASPAQVAEAIFEKLGLEVPELRDRNKTHTSTRDEVLHRLCKAYPEQKLPFMVLEYRSLTRLMNTWIESLPELAQPNARSGGDMYIHPKWENATATGRLSCHSPNIQATPKVVTISNATDSEQKRVSINIRSAFVARDGFVLYAVDYSQMELRIFAHLSEDPKLIDFFNIAGSTGGDVFTMMIEWMKESSGVRYERNHMKRTAYGIIYGQGARGLSERLNVELNLAENLITQFLTNFPGVKKYVEKVKESASKNGEVRMISGRRRPLPGILSVLPCAVARAERQAVNTTVQGSAADIIKLCMDNLLKEPQLKSCRLLAQMHDELLWEIPESQLQQAAKIISGHMISAIQLVVPLEVSQSVGRDWGNMKELNP